MEQKFSVSGMTCASCQAHVEKDVQKLNGVQSVNVSLLTNSMIVHFDESLLRPKDIEKAVKAGGYGAKALQAESGSSKPIEVVEDEVKAMKSRVVISMIFLVFLLYIAMGHMLEFPLPAFMLGHENLVSFAFTQFLLVMPIVYMNRSYFQVGLKRLWKNSPNMDSLIAIGSGAALLYGVFAIYMIGYGLGSGQSSIAHEYVENLYFEAAGAILALVTLGKYFEAISKKKTTGAIQKLLDLAPKTAIRINGDVEEVIPIEQIRKGDTLLVKPGSKIPVDGVIIKGFSSVDEQAITGESIPVEKNERDMVIGGTINQSGVLTIEVVKTLEDSTLMQIIKLVEAAATSKAPIQKLVDQISLVFVPIVIIISIVAFGVWLLLGQSFAYALAMGITVLVISCPCALGLATPVAIMVGTGKGAEFGVLIKSAESLEIAHTIQTVLLDKTGTITKGKPMVSDVVAFNNYKEEQIIQLAASLERNSDHPIAKAIMQKQVERNVDLVEVSVFENLSGFGLQGEIKGQMFLLGNAKLLQKQNHDLTGIQMQLDEFARQGKTPILLANSTTIIGIITIRDELKETSKQAVERLKKDHLRVIMLTGDNPLTARAIADEVGIDEVISDVLPDQKEAIVIQIQNQNQKVAMVGDGINDAVALMRSDVGIAIGAGTDVAIESADIVLMKDDLLDVATAIELSRKTIANIKMNLFWAFFYNVSLIPVAAGLFVGFNLTLNPMLASLAMSISSVSVVLNALRLRFFKPQRKEN